jgi:hypothetical protein
MLGAKLCLRPSCSKPTAQGENKASNNADEVILLFLKKHFPGGEYTLMHNVTGNF